MANTLDLTVPPLTTSGPEYAQIINEDLQQTITHNHDGVDAGALIELSDQLVSEDLSLNGHNLSNVRSVQFDNQPSVLTGSQDVNNIYVQENILGFNNSNGVFVPIVIGNSLAITSLPLTNFSIRAVSSTFSILNTATYNTIDIDSTAGAVTGTLPICAIISPVAPGRLFLFRDVAGAAGTNHITIQVAVGSGNTFGDDSSTSFIINNNFGYVAFYTDGVSKWFAWTQNVYQGETLSFQTSTTNYTASNINYDATTQVLSEGFFVQQGGLIGVDAGATMEIRGGASVSVNDSGTNWTWGASTTETYASGSTETHAAGSTLVLDGVLSGTTTTGTLNIGSGGTLGVSGILNLPGTTNLNGTSTMTGTANHLTGTFGVVGGTVALSSSGQITVDRSSSYTAGGTTNLGGEARFVTILSPGTYTIDSGPSFDNIVFPLVGTTPTGTWNINMPASPALGRSITIADSEGPDPATSSYLVNLNGNGHNFGIPGFGNPAGVYTPPSRAGSLTVDGVNSSDLSAGFWSLTFTYTGSIWLCTTGASFLVLA